MKYYQAMLASALLSRLVHLNTFYLLEVTKYIHKELGGCTIILNTYVCIKFGYISHLMYIIMSINIINNFVLLFRLTLLS